MYELPNKLYKIFDKLDKNKIKPIITGGFIRDKLLNIESLDIDIELYGISSFKKLENILKEFGDVNSVGKSFGVCKLTLDDFDIDFSFPRIDNKVASGHKGFNIEIKTDLDYETAASRRDFTINSIGYSPLKNKILDPYNGQEDIKKEILRAVNIETFSQDPLRVLRAAGFCSRFNFTLDTKLFDLCKKICDEDKLSELPKERIFGEIKKIFLKSQNPSIGFYILKDINAFKYLKPLDELDNETLDIALNSLDNIVKLKTNSNKTNIMLMLAILTSMFNTKQTKQFIQNITNEKKLIDDILSLHSNSFKNNYSDSELLKLATKVNIEYFLIFNRAKNNKLDIDIFDNIEKRALELNIYNSKAKPLLSGKDILKYGIKPSKEYSLILNQAYEAQLNLEIKTTEEAQEWLKNILL